MTTNDELPAQGRVIEQWVKRWQSPVKRPASWWRGLRLSTGLVAKAGGGLPTRRRALTRLTPLAGIAAPTFTLSDQRERTVSLGSLRGRIVVRHSRANHLEQLPNWHFLTGSKSALRRVWRASRIVVRRSRAGDLTHSDAMYLIDRGNLARWVAAPEYNKAAIPQWGGAIADIAGHVARTSNRPAQAGAGVL